MDSGDLELMLVMIGVGINLLLSIYSVYSQNNHILTCERSLCCDNFSFSDTVEISQANSTNNINEVVT